jgi:hypothetical protein
MAGKQILYSGCQYDAHNFRHFLGEHLGPIAKSFCSASAWLRDHCDSVYSRVISGDFVLFEFKDLCNYHQLSVNKRAFEIYRSICDHAEVNWRDYLRDPDRHTFYAIDSRQDEYAKFHKLASVAVILGIR